MCHIIYIYKNLLEYAVLKILNIVALEIGFAKKFLLALYWSFCFNICIPGRIEYCFLLEYFACRWTCLVL